MCMSEDLFGPAACVAFIFRTLEKHCLRRSLPREETCTGCLLHMPLPSPCAEEQAEEKTEPFRKHQDRQCPGQAGSTISPQSPQGTQNIVPLPPCFDFFHVHGPAQHLCCLNAVTWKNLLSSLE